MHHPAMNSDQQQHAYLDQIFEELDLQFSTMEEIKKSMETFQHKTKTKEVLRLEKESLHNNRYETLCSTVEKVASSVVQVNKDVSTLRGDIVTENKKVQSSLQESNDWWHEENRLFYLSSRIHLGLPPCLLSP